MTTPNKTLAQRLGAAGEERATAYLLAQGFTLVARNFRCPLGEIDIIVKNAQQLIFVEVKQRRSQHFGAAAEMVTPSKQKKIILSAQVFLQQHAKYRHLNPRFDVIALDTSGIEAEITWIPHAFDGHY